MPTPSAANADASALHTADPAAGEFDIAVIIPALDEEEALPHVLDDLHAEGVTRIIVCDNGSTDRTAAVARHAGAHVVHEPERGYGAACLKGLAHLADAPPSIVVFVDGDGSDDVSDLPRLLAPILANEADVVIGSRLTGVADAGSLTLPQRFGNWLACELMHAMYGVRWTDLGPFRAITWPAFQALGMRDRNFGWTVELQVKAALLGLRGREIPVRYRRRVAGRSKVSGTIKGTFLAGTIIISTILRYGRHKPAPAVGASSLPPNQNAAHE